MRHAKKIIISVAVLAAAALGGAALAGATSGGENGLSGNTYDRASKAALAETGGGKVTGSERDGENGATYEVEVTKDGKQTDVRLDDQFNVVVAETDHEDAGDDDRGRDDADDRGEDSGSDADDGAALTGATLDRASKAALAETGGGEVTGSERDSENGATYEVEVTKADGSQVDVRLDDAFKVIVAEPDHED
jgi:uncharacterized membrane protein YkoI